MTTKSIVTPLDDILGWSVKLPMWQRDALRRIVVNGQLVEKDHNELARICKQAFGVAGAGESTSAGKPMSSGDVPSTPIGTSVAILAISQAENVNAICATQELTFGVDGITVVFGYNGSGKSGYGRILKKACRARRKGGDILPNVLMQEARGPASAEVRYSVNGEEPASDQWIDAVREIEILSAVSFFDAECGLAHVGDKNGIAFMPFGLDALPKLGQACKQVQSILDQEKRNLESLQPEFLRTNKTRPDTTVGKLLRSLTADSEPAELTRLAGLQPEDTLRMEKLRFELTNDPRKMMDALRMRARRIASLAQILGEGSTELSDEKLDELKNVANDCAAKKNAARVAAAENFSREPLPDVGGAAWRELWEAARNYSTSTAYIDSEFPAIKDGARCVLCQQTLEPEAAARLHRFEKFVRDDTAAGARQAERTLASIVQMLDKLRIFESGVGELLAEIESEQPDFTSETRSSLATLKYRYRWAKRAVGDGSWDRVKPIMKDVVPTLRSLSARLEKQGDDVAAAVDQDHRMKLIKELADLEDREWLGTVVGDVKSELDRLRQIACLGKCIADTRTNAITAKSKALAKEHVTERLRRAFGDELQSLQQGVHRLSVELAGSGGEFGASFYQVHLVGATNAQIDSVVSEGEHRCIALAGFLAELSTQQTRSCIVFDDPVTSLDHRWRQSFARRLAEEGKRRQVIVFTHDVVFLHDLLDACDLFCVPKHIRRVDADRERAGIVNGSLPWIAMKISERIDALEKEARAAKTFFDSGKDDQYSSAVGRLYSNLRATVERAIEERVFRGVVLRHRDWINIVSLQEISVVTRADCQKFQALHKRCCDITDAHDHAALRSFGVPNPADLLKDIQQLKDLVDDLRARQNALAKE